jgi:hypothetical protein
MEENPEALFLAAYCSIEVTQTAASELEDIF